MPGGSRLTATGPDRRIARTNAQLARMAEREVFVLEGLPFAWADVVLAELHRGAWAELEQRTRAGLAARRASVASGRELSAAETTAAARAFRFERGLLAGEQLDAWLEGWGIGLAEWREYLRRDLLRGRSTGAAEFDPEEVSAAIGVEAICSGALEAAAGRLAEQAALAPPGAGPAPGAGRVDVAAAAELLGISPDRCAERLERVERLEAAATLARAELVEGSAIAEELAKRRQEWFRLELGVLALDDVDAAREALLCLRIDGLEPAVVARRARRELQLLSTTLAEAPEWLAPYVVGLDEGSVIGPVRHDPGFAVVVVESKREPSAEDPTVRERAEGAVVTRAARRQVAARITWRERF